ncbi:sporulation protein YjcA [Bacillus spizizenii]|uniref:Sporulation protein YjcA n=1 Tax=Bacillus spizizenii TaxID=96241 RepID=A0A9Q4E763_BACSC|nr:sporulation protein YjcA [Bacillus spizizenii]APH68065.1 sporulation protein [Bacillus subtilis]CUB25376.1 Sporulation protein YjcA [Bacillus cereus]KXJ32589.1 sporulation protein [Bacillus spizizenii]MCY7863809.1 sporulation protein YjcA [Bacillus spizizenii]MCY8453851.1 sporulation protein YjcA [Bacillus spizizenii]
MVINWLSLFLLSLAVFRLARLLVFDTIMAPLRSLFHEEKEEKDADGNIETYIVIKGTGVRAFIGELLSCYWCTGVWCAGFLILCQALIPQIAQWLILLLAIAGLAGIIETLVSKWLQE